MLRTLGPGILALTACAALTVPVQAGWAIHFRCLKFGGGPGFTVETPVARLTIEPAPPVVAEPPPPVFGEPPPPMIQGPVPPPPVIQGPVLPPPQLIPAPPPGPAFVRPLTVDEFARIFQPIPGRHEVVLLHTRKKCPVKVCFDLPPGCPKVKVHRHSIEFDYGKCEVAIRFKLFGKVHVDYDD